MESTTTARTLTRRSFLKGATALAGAAAASTSLFGGPLSSLTEGKADEGIVEDKWVTSVCRQCRVFCPIRVHVVNGVAVKIDGNPDDPNTRGRICGKSQAGLMALYNPYRVKNPMIRTNPEKGIDVDPQWLEITWDEAIDTLVEKLQPVLEEEPDAFEFYTSNFTDEYAKKCMREYFNTFGISQGASITAGAIGWQEGICGDAAHPATLRHFGGFVDATDYAYCNYAIFFGTNYFGSGKGWPTPTRAFLNARERGMHVVVIDPVQNDLARMADEWIPIKAGTDQAFALAMAHAMVLEHGIYDEHAVKYNTNSPYLIGPDGMYVRSTEELYDDPKRLNKTFGKPLVWDPVDNKAKCFDDPTIQDFALQGDFEVDGVACQPGFQIYLNFLEQYTPEWAEPICGVPAETIRRIAKEFGEAACVGQTMTFDDDPEGPYEVPYRPVGIVCHKGAQSHHHAMLICRAAYMILNLLGATNVVGSSRGSEGVNFETPPGMDGVMEESREFSTYAFSWPPKKTKDVYFFGPESLDMDILAKPEEHPEEAALYGDKLHRKVMYHQFRNPLKSRGNGKHVMAALKTVDFIWTVPLIYDEMTEMTDLLLPEGSYLERYACVTPGTRALLGSYWEFDDMFKPMISQFEALQQPVVEPVYNTRQLLDIMTEVAERMGYLDTWNAACNRALGISEEFALQPGVKYECSEMLDAHLKSKYDPDHGLEYFSTKGFFGKPATSRKAFYPYLRHPETRFPIYDEWWVWVREQYKADRAEHGLSPHTACYEDLIALPEWHGTGPVDDAPEEYDLHAVHYGNAFTAMCTPMEDPWRGDYMLKFAPSTLSIKVPRPAAEAKGLKTGDRVVVESQYGNTVEANVYVTECIRPDHVAITGGGPCFTVHSGPYSKNGTHFNTLLCDDTWANDPVTGNVDFSLKVKLTKI